MKLIIDIPEERLDSIKHFGIKQNEVSMLERALISGTPFDSVIEEERKKYNDIALDLLGEVEYYEKAINDIKAEIRRKHLSIVEKNDFDNGRTYGYEECLEILDNIGKAESEE